MQDSRQMMTKRARDREREPGKETAEGTRRGGANDPENAVEEALAREDALGVVVEARRVVLRPGVEVRIDRLPVRPGLHVAHHPRNDRQLLAGRERRGAGEAAGGRAGRPAAVEREAAVAGDFEGLAGRAGVEGRARQRLRLGGHRRRRAGRACPGAVVPARGGEGAEGGCGDWKAFRLGGDGAFVAATGEGRLGRTDAVLTDDIRDCGVGGEAIIPLSRVSSW